METTTRAVTPGIYCSLLALALTWGCVSEKKPQPAPPRTRAEAAKIQKTPARPAFKLDLPKLSAPVVAPAAKVVHLLYTSNADGELEPCG